MQRLEADGTLLLRNDPTVLICHSASLIYIVIAKPKQVMTKQEALVHAAWIVALADDKDEFERILEDVMAM